LVEAPGELLVGADPLAQLHERAYHVEAHLDGAGAVQDGRGHDGAVFGEGERREARVAVLLRTGRKMGMGKDFLLIEPAFEVCFRL
jgi:hypothetical protein